MAPLSRPALLAVLLLSPAILRAQSDPEGEAQALSGMKALKGRYNGAVQIPADAVAAAAPDGSADLAKLRASSDEIRKAGIPIVGLTGAPPQGMGWNLRNIADLGPAIEAASRAVEKLHEDNPSNVSATFYGNGSMVNLEDSIKWATGLWGGSDLKRGCVSHQTVTYNAVAPLLNKSSLEVHGVFVVRKVTGHHAVIVFPRGTDWKQTGVVLDGWIHQESAPDRMTYLFKDWYGVTSWKVSLE